MGDHDGRGYEAGCPRRVFFDSGLCGQLVSKGLLVDFALLELQQFLIGPMVGRVLMLGVLRNRVVTR